MPVEAPVTKYVFPLRSGTISWLTLLSSNDGFTYTLYDPAREDCRVPTSECKLASSTELKDREPLFRGRIRDARHMKGLQKIGRGNLSAMVYEQLRSALMSGYYAPGQRLTLVDLANELGTSVTPVREAIFRLAADGALEMPKAQTIDVPILSESSVAELKMIRMHLEGEAAAAAALKATRKEVAAVDRINEAFFKALDQGDPHQASDYNRECHL